MPDQPGSKQKRVNNPPIVGYHGQKAVADAEQQLRTGQHHTPVGNAIHEIARGRLHEKDAEAGDAGGEADGIIMPAAASQEVIHEGKNDARSFCREEVCCVQTNPAAQRWRDCRSRMI